MKQGRFSFAKKTGENENMTSSEYMVNIALQNNEKISTVCFTLIESACEFYNTMIDLETRTHARNKPYRQLQNQMYPNIRKEFFALIHSTKGYAAKVIRQNNVSEYIGTIEKAEKLSEIPYNRQNLRVFIKSIFEYTEMLQNTGIVPITAGYSQKDSFNALYTQ